MHGVSMLRVYVWQFPVRLFHWVNALSLLVLIVTGLAIGFPIAFANGGEASYSYWFGSLRFIHFLAAWVFLCNFVIRIYWAFVGNEHARWRALIPLSLADLRKQVTNAIDVLRVDIFQIRVKPMEMVGHNALAGWTYFVIYLLMAFQVATGFALYAGMSDSAVARAFAWVVPLMGSDLAVRQWHHAVTWLFVLFTLVHVYLAIFHDYVEGRGTVSSMVGGWKFIEKQVHEVSDD